MSTISLTNQDVGAQPRLNRAAIERAATPAHVAAARALKAHVERRQRLAAQARVENPDRTEEEIEARLEQFGA